MNRLMNLFRKSTTKSSDYDATQEKYLYDADPNPSVHPYTEDPCMVWQMMAPTTTVKTVTPMKLSTPVYDDKVRFVCMSDTHNRPIDTTALPPGDVFLHAGDFTNMGKLRDVLAFNDFLGKLPYKHKIVIAGNHELTFDGEHGEDPGIQLYLREHSLDHPSQILTNATVFLEDTETTVCGIRVYGSPWQPEFGGWAYNLPRGQALLDKWNMIPDGVDILMTHGPPIGYGDLCTTHQRAGCVELLATIQKRLKPKYHIAGHIHEDYGIRTDGVTTYINASTCTYSYRPDNPPIVFDLPLPAGASKLTPPTAPKNDWVTESSTETTMDVDENMENPSAAKENSRNTEGTGESMEVSENGKSIKDKMEDCSKKTEHSMDDSQTTELSMTSSKSSKGVEKTPENVNTKAEAAANSNQTSELDAKSKSSDGKSNEDFDGENFIKTEISSSKPNQGSKFFHKEDSDSDTSEYSDHYEPEWEGTEISSDKASSAKEHSTTEENSIKPKSKPTSKVCFSDDVIDMDRDSDEEVATKIDKNEERMLTRCYEEELQSKIVVHPYTSNPTKAWEMLSVKQTVIEVKPLDLSTPVYPDKVRFVCMSDTHNRVKTGRDLPPGDVFLHAGDFTSEGTLNEVQNFNSFLGTVPHKHRIVIAGNHELSFEAKCSRNNTSMEHYLTKHNLSHPKELLTNATSFLEDSEVTVHGLRIYGSPWQPEFCDWAFNLERGQELLDKWDMIPAGIDVLMTHGPPLGHGDLVGSFLMGCTRRSGCVELLATVQKRVKPKYHVFGHIHEAYGITSDGHTTFINASTCTRKYRPDNPPIIFNLPLPQGVSKDEENSTVKQRNGCCPGSCNAL